MKGALDKAICVCMVCGLKSVHTVYNSGLMGDARVVCNTKSNFICESVEGMQNLSCDRANKKVNFSVATLDSSSIKTLIVPDLCIYTS